MEYNLLKSCCRSFDWWFAVVLHHTLTLLITPIFVFVCMFVYKIVYGFLCWHFEMLLCFLFIWNKWLKCQMSSFSWRLLTIVIFLVYIWWIWDTIIYAKVLSWWMFFKKLGFTSLKSFRKKYSRVDRYCLVLVQF